MRKGQKASEEARRKMSEAKKGKKTWSFGKKLPPLSEERKKEISKALKGRIVTKETRTKISSAKKGWNPSEETRKRMSEAKKDKKPWNFGKKLPSLSEEHKKKISDGQIGKQVTEETKRKISEAQIGKSIPLEQREKMREAKKRFYDNGGVNPNKGKHLSDEVRRKISDTNREKFKKEMSLRGEPVDESYSSETKRLRTSVEYRIWREGVFQRDGYACIWCGHEHDLEADHIQLWSTHPELRFSIDNGRTLCRSCHQRRHRMERTGIFTLNTKYEWA